MGTIKQLDIEIQGRIEQLELPEYITALKVISYDSPTILRELHEAGYEVSEIDTQLVSAWAIEHSKQVLNTNIPHFICDIHPRSLLNGIEDEDFTTYNGETPLSNN